MEITCILLALPALLLGVSIGAVAARFAKKSESVRIWPNRASVVPRIEKRFRDAKRSIFLYGLSLEGTMNSHKAELVDALKRGVEVKILMLHPGSRHVEGHQEFSDRVLRPKIEENIELRMQKLFVEALTKEERTRLTLRATNYLPRFSANLWDDKDLYINFYLYKSSASDNPVIFMNDRTNAAAFRKIKKSLDDLFSDPDTARVAEDGKWIGLGGDV